VLTVLLLWRKLAGLGVHGFRQAVIPPSSHVRAIFQAS